MVKMNVLLMVLYGIIGLIIGYKIVELSYKIMVYKKGEEHIKKSEGFLDSHMMNIFLCIFNGASWALCGFRMENPLVSFIIGILITLGLIIAFIDLKIRIIPNEIVSTVIIVGILFQTIYYGPRALIGALISMIVMMVVFTSIASFVGFGKVGAGDVKLAGTMGLTLGYPLITMAVGIMAVVLLVFILTGMAIKKIYLSTMLPLAPFMISGFVFALLTLLI